eukprot:gene12149-15261_t
MSVFCKSITAANVFPQTLQTIHECVYSEGSSLRLKQQGMEFTVWVFRHAAVHQLKAMGPAVLKQGMEFTVCVFRHAAVHQLKAMGPAVLKLKAIGPRQCLR